MEATQTVLSKYDAYKDSGETWLGEIPTEWVVTPNKHIFDLKKSQVGKHSGKYDLLSLTIQGIIKRNLEDGGKFPAEFDTYQEVNKGDFVFCLFDVEETPRTVGLSDFDGMITGAYTVMRPRNGFHSGYLFYFYLNLDSKKRLRFLYKGLRNTIPKESFFSLKSLIPPLSEQTAIAAFLDEKTAQIDQAIAQKERLIELLKERKQILIQELVTGKKVWDEATQSWVKPTETVDSGVEWIGEIPKGWEVKRLKHFIANLESGVSVNASESERAKSNEVGVLKTSAVYTYSFDPKENKKVFKSDLKRVECSVKKDTIIISRMNAPDLVGASGYVFESYDNLYLPDRLWQTVFSTTADFNKRLISFNLLTLGLRHKLTSVSVGSSPSMKNISKNEFLSLRIAIPENLEEQNMIVKSIEINETRINNNIILNQSQIAKLKEYKMVLIDSAVTGKIKVPGV